MQNDDHFRGGGVPCRRMNNIREGVQNDDPHGRGGVS